MAGPVDLNFEVGDDHLQLWERQDWRYAFLMGGRGNGRSGTASRFVVSQLPGEEYTRGAIMRAFKEDNAVLNARPSLRRAIAQSW